MRFKERERNFFLWHNSRNQAYEASFLTFQDHTAKQTQPVELLSPRDQLVAMAAVYTTQQTQGKNAHALIGIKIQATDRPRTWSFDRSATRTGERTSVDHVTANRVQLSSLAYALNITSDLMKLWRITKFSTWSEWFILVFLGYYPAWCICRPTFRITTPSQYSQLRKWKRQGVPKRRTQI